MKVSVKSEYHKGIQPIRVLQHNIIHRYENTNADFLKLSKKLIDQKGLKTGVSYFVFPEPITYKCEFFKSQTPFVSSDGKIAIHETFLSYMWIVSYCMWVFYDEGVAKKMQNYQTKQEINKKDRYLIEQTEELFQYGKSLIQVYSEWDKDNLPNPEEYSKEEEFYILRANGIFINAINFTLYHEFAHVEKKHTKAVSSRTVDKSERKEFEKEADERAIELMLKGKDQQNDKSIELGILIGLASMLYFRNNVYGGDHHPDTDTRIRTYLEKINPSNEEPIWGVASLFFILWDNQFNLNLNWPKQINNFRELFYNTLEQIEKRKNVY